MIKEIDGIRYDNRSGIFLPLNEKSSSRQQSWITLYQISNEYPEFIDKIADILNDKIYSSKAKDYARSILQFLNLWRWISWKQFDSIMLMRSTANAYYESIKNGTQFVYNGSILSIKRNKISFSAKVVKLNMGRLDFSTDLGFDRAYTKIFGISPRFEEEEEYGMCVKYRKDGSRYFALPIDEEVDDEFNDYVASHQLARCNMHPEAKAKMRKIFGI